MEDYYNTLLKQLEGYTVMGLFDGKRDIADIVTLQSGPRGRVFFFDQEPMIRGVDDQLWDYIFQEPTIFANSELNSADKDYVRARYPNFVDWYYFANALVSREWFARYKHLRAGWLHKKHLLADFGLVTGKRQYRLFLYFMIFNYSSANTHQSAYLAYSADQPWKDDILSNDQYKLLSLDEKEWFPNANKDDPVINMEEIFSKSISYDNFGKNSLHSNDFKQTVIPIEKYNDINFVLVNETVFQENKKHLTEKIFKPIASGKPFVLAAGAKNLDYLKSYGFKSFDGCWKEDYDSIINPVDRLYFISKLMKNLINLNFGVKSLEVFNQAHQVAQQNREYFWSDDFYKLLMREATQNLDRAKFQLARKMSNAQQ